MKNRIYSALALATLLLAGCSKATDPQGVPQSASSSQNSLAGLVWTSGVLSANTIVPASSLRELPGVNGSNGLVGAPIWKSNNPEAVTGEGWLMTNGNNAPQRGGTATPLTGAVTLYVSHLNFTGRPNNQNQPTTKRDLYVHLIATNPSSTAITITGKGKIAANNLWRFANSNPATKSAWYLCSEAWINNTLDNVSVTIQPFKAVEIARAYLPATSSIEYTTEGRYEVNVAGGSAFFSSVATFDGSVSRAITFASGSTAQQATGNQGSPLITPSGSSNYGREAGIATNSAYYSGDVNITLPANASGPAWMGICYNTNNHQPVPYNPGLYFQNQSAAYTMRLQSSEGTWAGYGHKYNVKLILKNPNAIAQNVRVSLGANDIGDTNAVLFDAPVQVVTSSGPTLRQVTLYNALGNQTANGTQRRSLTTVSIPANSSTTVSVICYVPGLGFGAGLQLALESGI